MRQQRNIAKQQGMILLIMAFVVGVGVLLTVFHSINASSIRTRQDEETMRSLNAAKEALIGWAVSHRFNPGQMPWPDRSGDLNYDGSADCVATPFQYSFLLGQLPSQPDTSPCLDPNTGLTVYLGLSTYPSLSQEFRDAQGNRLWYAVSRNLVYDAQNGQIPVINPGMINAPYAATPYLRMGGTQSYPWLQVLDRNGNLVSDRVAAVIIAPGEAIGGQSRSGAALPNQFLDSFQIGAANFSNADSALADEDFIIGEDSRNVSATDPTFVQPYNFNDKLVYITIDELMAALEKRVGEEIRTSLRNYALVNGNYPWAAPLGGIGPAAARTYRCVAGNVRGALPINNPAEVCTYSATANSVNVSCSFQNLTAIEYRGAANSFNQSTGACTRTTPSTRCRCTGAGSCSHSINSTNFVCDAAGNCVGATASLPQRVLFVGSVITNSTNPVCGLGATTLCLAPGNTISRTITCDNPGAVIPMVTLGLNCTDFLSPLPAWFITNRWQDYIYYELTRPINPAGITVGNRSTGATLVMTGRAINSVPFAAKGASQVRPSCNENDYLDSAENLSTNQVYEATSMLKRNNYNDQTFVVAP